jgi:hypothetical protein
VVRVADFLLGYPLDTYCIKINFRAKKAGWIQVYLTSTELRKDAKALYVCASPEDKLRLGSEMRKKSRKTLYDSKLKKCRSGQERNSAPTTHSMSELKSRYPSVGAQQIAAEMRSLS